MTGLWTISVFPKTHLHCLYEHAEAYNLGTVICFHLTFCSVMHFFLNFITYYGILNYKGII